MEKNIRQALVPQYMKNFQCIGSACEDTCCQGWTVGIDKKTYKLYKNLRDKELYPAITDKMKRIKNGASDFNYAMIKMNEEGKCPLLNQDQLCSMQLKLGEDSLSSVCSTYPRILNRVNNSLEQSASLSCPEAARLALLNPDVMQFEEVDLEIPPKTLVLQNLNIDNPSSEEYYFWNVRVFTIEILQNRNFSITERLLVLGVFFDQLQAILTDQNYQEVPSFIEAFKTVVQMGTLRDSLNEVPTSYDVQFQIIKALIDLRLALGVKNQAYLECVQDTLNGLSVTDDMSNYNEQISAYRSAFKEHYLPFIENNQHILENYLVNYVYKGLFPFTSGRINVFEEYALLVIHYSMIKTHLIGMAGYHKNSFNTDLVIKLIYSFGRVIEHNSTYVYMISEKLKQKDLKTLAHLSILIKN